MSARQHVIDRARAVVEGAERDTLDGHESPLRYVPSTDVRALLDEIDDLRAGHTLTKGMPEFDVMVAAIEVAAHAPLRQGASVHSASISWVLIDGLRSTLETAGIDWRKVKAS